MQVDTAALEEAESLVYAMFLFVLINHIRITSNFVDVTENLENTKKLEEKISKWFIMILYLQKEKKSRTVSSTFSIVIL
jgi:hypothetical protein